MEMTDSDKTIDGFAYWIDNEENGVCYIPLNLCEKIMELLKEQEAKTGKWILDDEDANSWECSECGGLLIINDGTPHENDWYFCPYCGSKLEEQAVKWNV